VQVELGQQVRDLRRAALKQRQDPAHEPLVQIAHARATHGHGAIEQRELPRLPIAIPIAGGVATPTRMFRPPQQLLHFFLQHALQAGLDLVTHERFKRRPGRA
jgi:hypothetical protein